MKYTMWLAGIVMVMGLSLTAVFGADEVNPEVKKLVDRLASDIDQLAVVLPDNVKEEDKARMTEEIALLKTFAKTTLLPLCIDKVFVQEVVRQNDQKVTLEEIQKIDKEWIAAESELPIQKDRMNNTCAEEVKKITKGLPVLGEAFVMDNQGANVGQNALTSDYWQGDEPKWQKSYKEAKGGVDVGKRQLDKSTNVVDQKLSLPIIDDQGKVIGAVCWGVKVELLKQAVASMN